MKEFLIKALMGLLTTIIEKYVTTELIKEFELMGKKLACDKLDEFAASTKWTDIDDGMAKKVRAALLD